MNAPEAPALTTLAEALAAAKRAETEARDARLAVEAAILAHPEVVANIKDEGSVTIGGLVTVKTGENRTWDQAKLRDMEKSIAPDFWPFKISYSEVRKESRVIEEKFPELYAILRDALTSKPAKPSVALVGEKE